MSTAEPVAVARARLDPRSVFAGLAVPVLAIFLALTLGAVVVAIAGVDPVTALSALLGGAVGSPQGLANTVLRSLPIVITGIGIGIAFRSGALNLGGEGQMIAGALVSAAVANATPGLPGPVALLVALAAGCLAGGAWVFLPGLLQVRLEVPMLLTTLLFNYLAVLGAAWAASYPLRDLGGSAAVAQTATIPEAAWLPILVPGTRLHAGVLLLVVLPLLVLWALRRTVPGYELRMVGANRLFAEYGGVNAARTILGATVLSGTLCGLAGTLLVVGVDHRYIDTLITSAGFAWSGFIAAILTFASPLLTLAAGLLLGGLQVGAAGMARTTGVPLQVVDVVQAAIILVVAVRPGLRARLRRALHLE